MMNIYFRIETYIDKQFPTRVAEDRSEANFN